VSESQRRSAVNPAPSASAGKKPPRRGFNWAGFLIESAIAIVVFNVIAAVVTWYFILPRLKH
jgi:hypothetical protein